MRVLNEDFFCFHNKNLLFNLLSRNLKLKYRQSYLGILWTLFVPALNALIYFFVFKFVLRVGVPNYFLFVLSGLLAWQFFQSAIMQSLETMVANASLINKVPVAPRIFPFAEVSTMFIHFLLSLPILLVVAVWTKHSLAWENLFVIPLFILLYLQAYGFALMGSVSFVYLRDLRHFAGIILQCLFYLTPVLYNGEMLPEQFKWVMTVNPVGNIFVAIHECFVYDRMISLVDLGVSALWSIGILFIGFLVYKKYKSSLVENL